MKHLEEKIQKHHYSEWHRWAGLGSTVSLILPVLSEFEAIGDKWGAGLVISNIGHFYLHTGNLQEALRCCKCAYDMHEEIGSESFKHSFIFRLGVIHLYLNEYKIAIDYFQMLLSYIQEAKKTIFSIIVLYFIHFTFQMV